MKLDKGFTLVELAIVMIIVGLLIGGVLKGQQLIQNAKVTAVISEIKGYQASMMSFRDAYGANPGDMANATDRVSGCGLGNYCEDGNGNALIGGTGDVGDDGIINVWQLGAVDVTSEPAQFFKHLALANLITGVDPTSNILAWSDLYPKSALRGGYTITYTSCAGPSCQASPGGLVLRLHNSLTDGNIEGQLGSAPATSLEAGNIDRKLDDGVPFTGWVRTVARGNSPTTDHCEVEYSAQIGSKDCVPLFQIDG